jgi:hypothetical protein
MAKAGSKVTTWIRYSRAKKLIGDYLGWDAKSVDRELLKRLEARDIRWQCGRFEAPKGYSGPGPGDPEFFREFPNESIPDYGMYCGAYIIGDTATRSGGAIADDMEVAYEDIVKLKLSPPASDNGTKKKPQRPHRAKIEADRMYPYGVREDEDLPAALKKLGDHLQKLGIPVVERTLRRYLKPH